MRTLQMTSLIAIAILLLCGVSRAQPSVQAQTNGSSSPTSAPGTYSLIGGSCKGSAAPCGDVCYERNTTGPTLNAGGGINNSYCAMQAVASGPTTVCGFQMWVAEWPSPRVIEVQLWNDAGGKPGTILRTSTMWIGTTRDWYTATFSSPYTFTSGQKYWVGWKNEFPTISFPRRTTGTAVPYARRPIIGTTWQLLPGRFWSFKILCKRRTPCTLICAQSNGWCTNLGSQALAAGSYAVPVNIRTRKTICGMAFFTSAKSPTSTTVSLWTSDALGLPARVAAGGRLVVGSKPGWYKIEFSRPVTLAPGRYHVGIDLTPNIASPVCATGASSTHYHRASATQRWTAGKARWAWRLCGFDLCTSLCGELNTGGVCANVQLPEKTWIASPLQTASKACEICGFSMRAASGLKRQQTIKTAMWLADAQGKPGTLVRSSTMILDADCNQYYRTSWAPYPVASGQKFFVGYLTPAGTGSAQMIANIVTVGTPYSYCVRPENETRWKPQQQRQRWNYRIWDTGGKGSVRPVLSHRGAPNVGKSYDVLLEQAPPGAVGLLMNGTRSVPAIDLTRFGLTSCNLYMLADLFNVAVVSTQQGTGSIRFPIPNNRTLVGFSLFQQWLVVDKFANAAGLTLTNAGKGTIGDS